MDILKTIKNNNANILSYFLIEDSLGFFSILIGIISNIYTLLSIRRKIHSGENLIYIDITESQMNIFNIVKIN